MMQEFLEKYEKYLSDENFWYYEPSFKVHYPNWGYQEEFYEVIHLL